MSGPLLFLALALLVAAGAAATLRRRSGRGVSPHRMRAVQLVRGFVETLGRRHPRIRFLGLVPGRLVAVLEVECQETPVPLHPVLRHMEAFPDAADAAVDQLVEELTEHALEEPEDHDFAAVATEIMPQVRDLEWVSKRGRFGSSALVTKPLCTGLAVTYVVDGPMCMTWVCQEHLRRWRKSEQDLHRLAVQNLRRRTAEVPVPGRGEGPIVLCTGDGYDAARVLLLDPASSPGLLVALPDRDLLWLGSDVVEDLAHLMECSDAWQRQAPHPLSSQLFTLGEQGLVPVSEQAP